MAFDEAKLHAFMGQLVSEFAAVGSTVLMYVGDKLGLYRSMAGVGPLTPGMLAERTGTHERYVREWLNNQAAGGYVTYDPVTGTYELPDEHAFALANEESPVCVAGGPDLFAAMWADADKLAAAFRTGEGIAWQDHDPRLFPGVERFFKPQYRANLTTTWIPAADGLEDRLKSGIRVADVGCGHGASTIVMAQAYPKSTFVGFDFHARSIEAARKAAAAAGLDGNVAFEVAGGTDFPGAAYDLVCFFDCLHDMGDPVGAAKHARETLAEGGVVLMVEPFANDKVEENFNPVGRMYYAGSTAFCTPASMAQEVGLALGAQAGEARLAEVMRQAGFSEFRRVTETPFNLVLEARR